MKIIQKSNQVIVAGFLFAFVTATDEVNAQTASFTDWNGSGFNNGDMSGTANWAGYGFVSVNFSSTGDADFMSVLGAQFPFVADSQGGLEPFGPDLTAAGALTWLSGGTEGIATSTATFTFSGGDFPSDSVFYLTDNDVEAVKIEAFNNGVAVDVSNWFFGNVQTQAGGFGLGSGWDPVTATTIPFGANAEFWVQQFRPDADFDELRITNSSSNGRIGFTIGNVALVPEPSTSVLLGLGGFGLLVRRKRD